MNESQKARIVELGQKAVSELQYARHCRRHQDNGAMFSAEARARNASAEAFRIAQECRA